MRITHKKYGTGTIIPDNSGFCKTNEVYVKFDNPLPFLDRASDTGAISNAVYRDIVNKEDINVH